MPIGVTVLCALHRIPSRAPLTADSDGSVSQLIIGFGRIACQSLRGGGANLA